MKSITWFYMNGCPYCRNAQTAYDELIKENPQYKQIDIKQVNETVDVAYADSFDYYYVPTFYLDDKKVYECQPSHHYPFIKEKVREVLDQALQ